LGDRERKIKIKILQIPLQYLTLSLLVFLGTLYGCATSLKTVQRGNVNASMTQAVQDTKDALNTYGFDIQNIETASDKSRVTGKRVDQQEAWVEIKPNTNSSSAIEVKVNQEGSDEVGADVILKDIKGRSQK